MCVRGKLESSCRFFCFAGHFLPKAEDMDGVTFAITRHGMCNQQCGAPVR